MPLMPAEVFRFDVDRMAFKFTMLDSEGETVRCQISGARNRRAGGHATWQARGRAITPASSQILSH